MRREGRGEEGGGDRGRGEGEERGVREGGTTHIHQI